MEYPSPRQRATADTRVITIRVNNNPTLCRPLSGLAGYPAIKPGVPLRSTPGFMLPPASQVGCISSSDFRDTTPGNTLLIAPANMPPLAIDDNERETLSFSQPKFTLQIGFGPALR